MRVIKVIPFKDVAIGEKIKFHAQYTGFENDPRGQLENLITYTRVEEHEPVGGSITFGNNPAILQYYNGPDLRSAFCDPNAAELVTVVED